MIEVTGAFSTKWYDEWEAAKRMAYGATKSGYHGRSSTGDDKRVVEYFLEAMKYELAKIILEEPKIVLDRNPGEEHTPQAG